jgi:glycosyltransferase involved in cell wall biosynthesis
LNEPTQKPIAFLFPAFPVLHQTFVLWEVLALRERGVPIALFSLKRPSTSTQQPEGEALRHQVHYLPSTPSLPVLRDNVSAFLRAPLRYLGVYRRMVYAWWRDRNAGREWKNRRISESAPDRELTRREYVQGRFNRSPLLYLVKSMWLVPVAIHLGNVLRAKGIERIHAHWASYPTTVALAAHWMFDIPFSFTAHAYDIYLVPRLLSVKVEEADFAVTCARVNATFLRSLASEEAGRHVIVNYHGVNLDRFRPLDRAASAAQPCLVTCGRLEPYKGHHVLLRACALLSQPVRCVIVGEGPQRERLERLAAELGIADRVELTGPVPQTQLTEIYAQADLFVLASVILERSGKRDVIPNVLAEAMAMQLPVVATDISGIGELVTDGVSGRLVRPNDVEALARVISELLADPQQRERLARGGAAKVAAEFDRKENIEALTTLFKRGFAPADGEVAALQTIRSPTGRNP